jgi:uncharacterized protein YigE (DUF2233 family)
LCQVKSPNFPAYRRWEWVLADWGIETMRSIILTLAAVAAIAASRGAEAEHQPCRPLVYERKAYTVCEVDLRKHAVRLYWKRPSGTPYGYLNALPQSLEARAGKLMFAINAGMFDAAFKPVGLYVEQGRELVHANTRPGYGNFHMKPNGVFYVAGDRAGVLETTAYLKENLQADLATQSGPMLVINGRLHPRFDRNSRSLKPRTGVGVRDAHTVLFAISEGDVSFAAFASLFRDGLRCTNALFLDGGSASNLYAPTIGRGSNLLTLGPMLGVFEKSHPSAAK